MDLPAIVEDGAPAESVAVPGASAAARTSAAPDPAAVGTATRPPWGGRRPRAAALASVAMAVPDNVVTNETIAADAGVTEQWIVHRTGVRERRHVREGERLDTLAAAAGRQALDEAGLAPAEVDLVLVATVAADELTPNAAPLVAQQLGAHGAGAMDVGAACTGYLSALSLAAAGYTAFLFRQAKGREFWDSPWLLPHLVIQSIVAGAALELSSLHVQEAPRLDPPQLIEGKKVAAITVTGAPQKLFEKKPVKPDGYPWPISSSQLICAAWDVRLEPARNSTRTREFSRARRDAPR